MIMFMYKEDYLHIALAELNISWEDKEKNQEKCKHLIAAARHADIIIFPEMTLTGFSMNVEKIAEEKEASRTLEFFMELSEKYHIAIAFGMAEYADSGSIISNNSSLRENNKIEHPIRQFQKAWNKSYLVFGRKILLEYAKLHPFSYGEESKYYQGGNKLAIAELNGIRLSPLICYDLRFPEPFQILSAQADFIFIIANWPKIREEHWTTLLKARAIENQCYIAGVNRCGNTYPTATAVYDPYGNKIDTKGDIKEISETFYGNLYFAVIDKTIVEKYRREFPLKNDRRECLYKELTL